MKKSILFFLISSVLYACNQQAKNINREYKRISITDSCHIDVPSDAEITKGNTASSSVITLSNEQGEIYILAAGISPELIGEILNDEELKIHKKDTVNGFYAVLFTDLEGKLGLVAHEVKESPVFGTGRLGVTMSPNIERSKNDTLIYKIMDSFFSK